MEGLASGLALIFVLPLILVIFALVVGLLQWLWNMTMPEVFDFKQITFWQALRLILIVGILLGPRGFGGS